MSKTLPAGLGERNAKPETDTSGPKPTPSSYDNFRAITERIYSKVFLEFMLRQKKLPPSKDGRHIPLRLDTGKPLHDERRGHSYIDNTIRTSRYTIYDFVPKQLLFQFSRVGNFYFLCVGVPQTIPGLSTTGNYTTILPLMFFVLLTMAKEGFDDYRRHRLDMVENATKAMVLKSATTSTGANQHDAEATKLARKIRVPFRKKPPPEKVREIDEEFDGFRWRPTNWSDIRVGDIIKLERDDPVPADIILLHTDGEDSIAFIETMALDGETSLKSKQVSPAIEGCGTIEGIRSCPAQFILEDPNPDLYSFDGKVTVGDKTLPLTLNEIVYRGSILRNTGCATGLVINTGEECKIRLNANQHPTAKKPALERIANRIVITLATYVLILSIGVSIGYVIWQKNTERNSWYLKHARVRFHEIIIAYIIQFNNVIPLALYISLEIVKVGQLIMLHSDIGMYDEATDTRAKCNTNTILENLGQVGYIFSDKTGTLTENVMKFRKMSIAGTSWLHEADLMVKAAADGDAGEAVPQTTSPRTKHTPTVVTPEERLESPAAPPSPNRRSFGRRSSSHWRSTGRPDHVQPDVTTTDLLDYIKLRPNSVFTKKAKQYILAMALCHTCLPEIQDGKLGYQASSPDELALVKAAQELGYTVIRRSSQSVTLQISKDNGSAENLTFDILDIVEFSSKRKRMSIILRFPDGRICVICKGADSAILPRLRMAPLAMQKASEVRKSVDLEHEMLRRSLHESRNSYGVRRSLTIRQRPQSTVDSGPSTRRPAATTRSQSFEASKIVAREERPRLSLATRTVSFDIGKTILLNSPAQTQQTPDRFTFLEDHAVHDESTTFTRCFKHLDDFATEGLRTLVYAQRFITEADYQSWKRLYDAAATSLVNRQDLVEAAGEVIEQSFDLVGASAIEDKLQAGVPETIDKLRRANIRIWMLTGDKRETAINIAHSARICLPGSDLFILDVTKGSLADQMQGIAEDLQDSSHSVVVIDGHTLSVVELSPDLTAQFYSVMPLVDSVICCRASPAQKALLVHTVRTRLRKARGTANRGLTLAIGDGANDLAMIEASHVGVGISGKEGLQAARVADYSIAQFRFLQRLLLVHGRWNYIRTAKFIIATFWKEMFFYLPTALYQRYNGYTGTSLYEYASLTVFNTLFTSLCVICMGIWEQDLRADTLLAVPELYMYGQRNLGLNMLKFFRWMLLGAVQGVLAWFGVWAGYGWRARMSDQGLYALGNLSFSVGVLWINWKLFVFETHYKTGIVVFSFFLTTLGWWAWNAFLSGVYARRPSIYAVRDGFTHTYGRDLAWWATLLVVLGALGLLELSLKIVKRRLIGLGLYTLKPWKGRGDPGEGVEDWDLEVWQEMEQDPVMRERLRKMANGEEDGDGEDEDEEDVEVMVEDTAHQAV